MGASDSGERIAIDIGDIPQSLLVSIQEGLVHYFASMSILDRDKLPTAIGSGAFVSLNGQPCILTAAHVWLQIERAGGALFTFGPSAEGFSIDARTLRPHVIGDGAEREWGPDLALLQLAPPEAAIVASKRNFLNLVMQAEINEQAPVPSETDLMVICGNVAVWSKLERAEKGVTLRSRAEAFFSLAAEQHERDGYDFVDVGVNYNVEGIPEKFGGVSGGPLWIVTISKSKKTGSFTWDGRRRLIGVAYWESARQNNRRVIRCHGPSSLYDTALKEWSRVVS